MAHMARAAGTDYAVAGGKTLIDGTAYSVVATREVENTQFISGSFSSNGAASVTLENSLFDWNKYKVAAFAIMYDKTKGVFTGGSVYFALVANEIEVNYGTHQSNYDSSMKGITMAVTQYGNGYLKITSSTTAYQSNPKFYGTYNYIVVLEAKA